MKTSTVPYVSFRNIAAGQQSPRFLKKPPTLLFQKTRTEEIRMEVSAFEHGPLTQPLTWQYMDIPLNEGIRLLNLQPTDYQDLSNPKATIRFCPEKIEQQVIQFPLVLGVTKFPLAHLPENVSQALLADNSLPLDIKVYTYSRQGPETVNHAFYLRAQGEDGQPRSFLHLARGQEIGDGWLVPKIEAEISIWDSVFGIRRDEKTGIFQIIGTDKTLPSQKDSVRLPVQQVNKGKKPFYCFEADESSPPRVEVLVPLDLRLSHVFPLDEGALTRINLPAGFDESSGLFLARRIVTHWGYFWPDLEIPGGVITFIR